jgi:hypothetical protein
MKTLSEKDWADIRAALANNNHLFDPKFNTIDGIQEQIDNTDVGRYIYYPQQNAPFEYDENNKIIPQFDEAGNQIPLVTIVQCQVIEQ